MAAGAAWRTAAQGQKLLAAADQPFLEVQVLANAADGMLMLSIINTGTGVARGTNWAVHALGQVTDDILGDGFMQPGEKVHILTTIGPLPRPAGQMRPDLDDLGAMVTYRDVNGFVHYRTHTGEHDTPKTWLRRRPKYPERTEVFRKRFPEIPLSRATRAANKSVRPGGTGA
ncbi:MAG TPA: hypothetical protein VGO71_13745 [Baekduia sp.]|nr:hypothetical protein [Baekduia sp.]